MARSTTTAPASSLQQLLFLEAEDPDKDIMLYINSPGGSVSAGYGHLMIPCSISAAMFPPFAWAWQRRWARFCWRRAPRASASALPNAEIMIHQPSGGAQGQATDIAIVADRIVKTKAKLNRILAERTGQPLEKVAADAERDYYMDAEEAKAYGLVDEIIACQGE